MNRVYSSRWANGQVKKQNLGGVSVACHDAGFVHEFDRVAGLQRLAVYSHLTAGDVHVAATIIRQGVLQNVLAVENRSVEGGILMYPDGAFAPVR